MTFKQREQQAEWIFEGRCSLCGEDKASYDQFCEICIAKRERLLTAAGCLVAATKGGFPSAEQAGRALNEFFKKRIT